MGSNQISQPTSVTLLNSRFLTHTIKKSHHRVTKTRVIAKIKFHIGKSPSRRFKAQEKAHVSLDHKILVFSSVFKAFKPKLFENFLKKNFHSVVRNQTWLSKMNLLHKIIENRELVSTGEAESFSSLVLFKFIILNGEEKDSACPKWAGKF